MVWRVDRLGRSLIDVLNTVNLLRERGVLVRSLPDGIDSATLTSRLTSDMLAILAEYEPEFITERVSAGVATAEQGGTRFGRSLSDRLVISDELALVTDARSEAANGRGDVAQLVEWGRATLYRYPQALVISGRTGTGGWEFLPPR